ncbi:hypothetical protein [Burkholderia ambifaria]|uniref:hypothetical protein n=1 Tax=Burkholderia ambifaria TaxID=152480 RepID=UPI001589EE0F|nr:hypothetical protein [Burkholderia ambifaria]
MAKKKFSFTTAEGAVETRTSERAYTHVVLGRRNLVQARARAASAAERKMHAVNYDYYRNYAETDVGQPYPGRQWTTNQADHDAAVQLIAEYPTVEAYIEAKVEQVIARINDEGTGDAGPEIVLQWSQSLRAAQASVSGHAKWHVGVRVAAL